MNKILFSPLILLALLYACKSTSDKSLVDNTAGDKATVIEKGKQLVTIIGCNDCHSVKIITAKGLVIDSLHMLSGHPANEKLVPYDKKVLTSYILFTINSTASVGPWGTSFAANLTPDQTGIGNWTEEQFLVAMKKGKWKGQENGRDLLPPMPWQGYSLMPDEDIKAIFAYLKSIKPVNNVVPMAIAPGSN